MMLRGARIFVVFGIVFFGLRGVFGVLPPLEFALCTLLLLGGAAAFERLCAAGGGCAMDEAAVGEGRRSSSHLGRLPDRQSAD